ncbi:putative ER lumen protein retaining receptor [Helianthus annuus]|uniref:ER lumen protein retaining receptor n=1 Tax=Helianthus annuus TaxID=4232 RepID=A0A251TF09_HELAN|nr:ER lumen protein-retaining receptor [Helianthus annuus]KAF5784736.1 putative ER lumen protein retaining receptor [Helianthus annuus]KAJ0512403.1 putative ER lumen protein retaining receptor [Helianthus annuus]KAJ0519884.1 putative ER lumen protein retaining receptor [Helianthus annuus]KAJ0528518.1 putative ER lumen protein retaining receptor [Helianthus annuus]KAJ0695441.1 putative ER lumen protein retaining receptor [Helianthus annuus]
MGRKRGSAVNKLFIWVRKQSMKVKIFLAVASVLSCLIALRLLAKDTTQFFVASEFVHAAGIILLIYKLTKQKTCSGLSLQTQELTAIFLAVRLCCSLTMENDIHTFLDFATLASTLWVVYMIRCKLQATYNEDLDDIQKYYLVVPCVILAMFIYPHTHHCYLSKVMWAFCVYLEAIAVLPQLTMMQKTKMIEPSTARYVFALGVARFLGCAHWIIQVYESAGAYLFLLGTGYYLWLPAVLLAEVVQSFILADFCYYYVKSLVNGQLLVSLPPV